MIQIKFDGTQKGHYTEYFLSPLKKKKNSDKNGPVTVKKLVFGFGKKAFVPKTYVTSRDWATMHLYYGYFLLILFLMASYSYPISPHKIRSGLIDWKG